MLQPRPKGEEVVDSKKWGEHETKRKKLRRDSEATGYGATRTLDMVSKAGAQNDG